MTQAAAPHLEPGRVYRTSQLAVWGANTARLAKRLVREGELSPLAHGLFVHQEKSRFGLVPPEDSELMRAFLDNEPFVFTGPDRWNALGLGTTAVHAMPTVYNTKRSGIFKFGRRKFILRRVAFPKNPSREWYVVDLFEHADQAASQPELLAPALDRGLKEGRFDRKKLKEMAETYGSKKTLATILSCLEKAA